MTDNVAAQFDRDMAEVWSLVRRNLQHYDSWEDCLDDFVAYWKSQEDWPSCLDCKMEIRECNCDGAVPRFK
jgi:hypothetical protein